MEENTELQKRAVELVTGQIINMLTKNIWNVAQRFYMFLCNFDYDESRLLSDGHVSCK